LRGARIARSALDEGIEPPRCPADREVRAPRLTWSTVLRSTRAGSPRGLAAPPRPRHCPSNLPQSREASSPFDGPRTPLHPRPVRPRIGAGIGAGRRRDIDRPRYPLRRRRRAPGRTPAHHRLRRAPRRLRDPDRRHRRALGRPRTQGQTRLGHQRRHRPLARSRRPPRQAATRRSPRRGPRARGGNRSPRHPRRRTASHPRKPARPRPPDPPMERRHRHRPAPERLPSRPPLHRGAGPGRRLHGDRPVLLSRRPPSETQSRLPLLARFLPETEPVRSRRRGGDRLGHRPEDGSPRPARVAVPRRRRQRRSAPHARRPRRPQSPLAAGPRLLPQPPEKPAHPVPGTNGGLVRRRRSRKIAYVEAFEICEYGRRPDKAELQRLFPVQP
jgi:hypothetical protein